MLCGLLSAHKAAITPDNQWVKIYYWNKQKIKCGGSENWSNNNHSVCVCVTNLWVEHGSADLVPCLDVNIHQTGRPWWAHRWSLQQSQTVWLQTSPPLWTISSSMSCHWPVLQNRTKRLITLWEQLQTNLHINKSVLLNTRNVVSPRKLITACLTLRDVSPLRRVLKNICQAKQI